MRAFCGRAGFYLGTGALEARHTCLFQEQFNEIDCLLCAQHCTTDIISSRILSWMDSESDPEWLLLCSYSVRRKDYLQDKMNVSGKSLQRISISG